MSITEEKSITEAQFIEGLSQKHETFVSENDLRELFVQRTNGIMPQQDFERLLDVKSYFEIHQIYAIDQLQFLNALIEGYASMRIRNYKELESLICSKVGKKEKLNREDVALLVSEIDTNAKADKIFDFTEDINTRLFKKKIFELNLGGLGMGCFNLKSIEKICDSKAVVEDEKIFK